MIVPYTRGHWAGVSGSDEWIREAAKAPAPPPSPSVMRKREASKKGKRET